MSAGAAVPSSSTNDGKPVLSVPFRAVLRPNRSLSPRGFLIMMAVVTAVSFVAGLAFYLIGAWPVLGFFGLDVLLIYGAFKLNYRAGRLREVVEINGAELTFTREHPSRRRDHFICNPYWASISLREETDGRTKLTLSAKGKAVVVGRFLTNDERQSLAKALQTALIAARGGTRI